MEKLPIYCVTILYHRLQYMINALDRAEAELMHIRMTDGLLAAGFRKIDFRVHSGLRSLG